jgi:hypothetical protein
VCPYDTGLASVNRRVCVLCLVGVSSTQTRDLSDGDWQAVAAAFQPYFAWPQPFCQIATDMVRQAGAVRQRLKLAACVQFLQHYPTLVR